MRALSTSSRGVVRGRSGSTSNSLQGIFFGVALCFVASLVFIAEFAFLVAEGGRDPLSSSLLTSSDWVQLLRRRGGTGDNDPSTYPPGAQQRQGGKNSMSSASSYQLAYKQSYGFFDDITNENWHIAQSIHAKSFPNHYSKDMMQYSSGPNDKGNIPKLKISPSWNAENFQEEFHCLLSRRLPSDSNGDGPKWLSDPYQIGKKKDKDCLVYSVGSNGKVEFEKAVKEEIGSHCEVHTFDMVTRNRRNGDFATALEGYATFHPWGFAPEGKGGRNMKLLGQTVKELGHENRTIDIFKIDCEWCEWFTYRDWIEAPVQMTQILVETHNAPMPNAKEFFYALHDAGYVIFSKEANFQNQGGGVEFGFLKLRTDFFINGTMYQTLEEQEGKKTTGR